MKISELQQPYRRMAEYLGNENNTISHSLNNNFFRFYNKMHKGEYPEITLEIKRHFPADFDFSEEEENNTKSIMLSLEELFNLILETHTELSKMGATGMVSTGRVILNNIDKVANLNKENQRKIEDENLQKRIYTQLAKEGKFDELPATCEFSEPGELEVGDDDKSKDLRKIIGKFKGNYMDIHCIGWKNAQLPTPKIDFSQFKSGDVVEVEVNEDTFICYYAGDNEEDIFLDRSKTGLRFSKYKKDIKSITKIK